MNEEIKKLEKELDDLKKKRLEQEKINQLKKQIQKEKYNNSFFGKLMGVKK